MFLINPSDNDTWHGSTITFERMNCKHYVGKHDLTWYEKEDLKTFTTSGTLLDFCNWCISRSQKMSDFIIKTKADPVVGSLKDISKINLDKIRKQIREQHGNYIEKFEIKDHLNKYEDFIGDSFKDIQDNHDNSEWFVNNPFDTYSYDTETGIAFRLACLEYIINYMKSKKVTDIEDLLITDKSSYHVIATDSIASHDDGAYFNGVISNGTDYFKISMSYD